MEVIDQVWIWLITNGTKLVGAIVFLIVGFMLSKFLVKQIVKILRKRKLEEGLISFSSSFLNIALKALILISVMGMVGIEMTSFIALIGAAGLAVGMALQGTLANFAGGVMILLFKPYKVGDFIEAQGYSGSVKEILIFNTILNTVDNKIIIVPNSSLSTSSLINYSQQHNRRVEWSFRIAYGADFNNIKEIVTNILNSDDRVLKDPSMFIGIDKMADTSLIIIVRAWTQNSDLWNVYYDVNEILYNKFNEQKIIIPFPQLDVHIKN